MASSHENQADAPDEDDGREVFRYWQLLSQQVAWVLPNKPADEEDGCEESILLSDQMVRLSEVKQGRVCDRAFVCGIQS